MKSSLFPCAILSGLFWSACGTPEASKPMESRDIKNDLSIEVIMVDNTDAQGRPIHSAYDKLYPALRLGFPIEQDKKAGKKYFGMRVDCGSNYELALRAFGYENLQLGVARTIKQNAAEYESLGIGHHAAITCSPDNRLALEGSLLFATVSENQDHATRYFLKLPEALDPTPESTDLYELKCNRNFDFLVKREREYIPITEGSLPLLYGNSLPSGDDASDDVNAEPGSKNLQIWPLTCTSGAIKPHDPEGNELYKLPQARNPLPIDPPAPSYENPKLYLVTNSGQDERLTGVSQYFMVVSDGLGYPINCGSNYRPLLKALGMDEGAAARIDELNPIWQGAHPRKQPVLSCTPANVDRMFKASDYTGDVYYMRFQDSPDSLVRLGCKGLHDLYQSSTLDPVATPAASLKYMMPKPQAYAELSLGCHLDFPPETDIKRRWNELIGDEATSDDLRALKKYMLDNQYNWTTQLNAAILNLAYFRKDLTRRVQLNAYRHHFGLPDHSFASLLMDTTEWQKIIRGGGYPEALKKLGNAQFVLKSSLSGRVLDLPQESTGAINSHVQQWDEYANNMNQKWNLVNIDSGIVLIRSAAPESQMCLQAAPASFYDGNDKGGVIVQAPCNRLNPEQRWRLEVKDQRSGEFMIRNGGTPACMDVLAGSLNNGAYVGHWTCNRSVNQSWTLSLHSINP